jgi:hypothetical protein
MLWKFPLQPLPYGPHHALPWTLISNDVGSLLSRQASITSWQAVFSFLHALISANQASILASYLLLWCESIFSSMTSRSSITCSMSIVWQYNDQDPMQYPVPLLIPVVTCMGDYRWGLDWRLDLLTTWTHDSWLLFSIVPSLISALYKSLEHRLVFPVCYCLH